MLSEITAANDAGRPAVFSDNSPPHPAHKLRRPRASSGCQSSAKYGRRPALVPRRQQNIRRRRIFGVKGDGNAGRAVRMGLPPAGEREKCGENGGFLMVWGLERLDGEVQTRPITLTRYSS